MKLPWGSHEEFFMLGAPFYAGDEGQFTTTSSTADVSWACGIYELRLSRGGGDSRKLRRELFAERGPVTAG